MSGTESACIVAFAFIVTLDSNVVVLATSPPFQTAFIPDR